MKRLLLSLILAAPMGAGAQSDDTPSILTQYQADRGSLRRFYIIQQSPERCERFRQLDRDYLARLGKLNFAKLPTDQQVDYVLFKRNLEADLKQLETEATEYQQVKERFPFADSIYVMEKRRRRGLSVDGPAIARELDRLSRQVDAAKAANKTPLPGKLAQRAGRVAQGLREALKSVYTFYYDYDPDFTWWVAKPYQYLYDQLAVYGRSFDPTEVREPADSKEITGIAAGREELVRQLAYEYIPYSPEELVDIANKEFAWCDKELLKASREMGFGDNWKAAQEKVKNSYVPAGEQPALILRLYNESIDFLKKNDLITIPPVAEETWRMSMMSPERQLVNPFFLGGEEIIISYPTSGMAHADKLMSMRGNNPHFSKATVHHELIAGHHLQGFMNDRYKTYRNFDTPFWTEGWALYWEMLLWDKGFAKTPEDRIGMLFWRMHRCARIIFSLNFHLGNWTPQQCVDFLVDRVGHERANAEGEVRRSFAGNYPPLYQLAYMTGGLQFYALHKELVDSKKMTDRAFHDAIMRLNALPVELIRASLTDRKLKPDYQAGWRFYDGR
ncbi:DUF885 family protein [Siphonobacter aquaeclarae]|uniref:DUF885 domain-containing protein n=1 Tax=Siphonobacter aquaeclarae TaxID=563176 RepID=A0A1G9IPV3_9BACT|nr:DUF885 family protein [Siphonobacter aquaeclarae]SDL27187.1 protein of unknown function [Siphonobacter aquaeclarae]